MTDQVTGGSDSEQNAGFSRRNALKAGVAAGVGVAAWSGASITSLGGTPAYAISCSQTIFLDLSNGCRNTDSASSDAFRYHPLKRILPTGFQLLPLIPVSYPVEGTECSEVDPLPQLVWDHTVLPNLTCKVFIEIYTNGDSNCTNRVASKRIVQVSDTGSSTNVSDGSVTVPMTCQGLTQKPNGGNYTIFANCNTTGAPSDCFNPA